MAKSKRNGSPEINASSMADIAFLLLIFFLVTTTIDQDKGLIHRLPEWTEDKPPIAPSAERNVLEILVNSNNQLLVEQEYIDIDELKPIIIKHLENRGELPNFSDSPKDAIISLKNDRGTDYGTYIQIQNELKAGYAEVRDKLAAELTDGEMTFSEIDLCSDNIDFEASRRTKCEELKVKIQEEFPMKISEAEPVNLGGK
jgi:biopolymer transport protein ExbD